MSAEKDEAADVYHVHIAQPDGIILGDGDFAIFDKLAFAEATQSIAAQVRGVDLFVFQPKEGDWVNIKDVLKKKPSGVARLATVRKDRGE